MLLLRPKSIYDLFEKYRFALFYKNVRNPLLQSQFGESLVTLRLLKSGGKDFDLNVTRYTNSQNPVDDRDFCANDDIQIMLPPHLILSRKPL
ncbi:MAG: hypothetical protein RLZZ86_237 [Cyanobacteriota bacterium]|jgi:hypothetical protein